MHKITKMEKKLNSKSEEFITRFKDSIRTKAIDLKFDDKSKINVYLNMFMITNAFYLAKTICQNESASRIPFPLKIVAMPNAPTTNNAPANAKMDLSFAEPIRKVLHTV